MTPSKQFAHAQRVKSQSINSWVSALNVPFGDIVAEFRRGVYAVTPDQQSILLQTARREWTKTVNRTISFDYREYKQEDDPVLTPVRVLIAAEMTATMLQREPVFIESVTSTIETFMQRTYQVAAPDASNRELRNILKSYLSSHRLIIAVSESTFISEKARRAVVVNVADPLNNSVQRVLDLLEAGQFNEARKLSRSVLKLATSPISLTQGQIIDTITSDPRLYSPLVQASRIRAVREDAGRLGSGGKEKVWRDSGGPNVRPSHSAATGQVKPIDEPFELANGFVMYPGDGSLGAPLSEIIGCQCVSIYL